MIVELEETLRRAMLASDIGVLDQLLAPELIFTTHLGQVLDKTTDLALHRDGVLQLQRLDPSEMRVQEWDKGAIVSVRMQVEACFSGTPFNADLRYTRFWRNGAGGWQVLGGHSSAVQAPDHHPATDTSAATAPPSDLAGNAPATPG